MRLVTKSCWIDQNSLDKDQMIRQDKKDNHKSDTIKVGLSLTVDYISFEL